jgi:hypothetical protein
MASLSPTGAASARRAFIARTTVRVGVLLFGFIIGMRPAVLALREGPPAQLADITRMEAEFAGFRSELPRDARVGLIAASMYRLSATWSHCLAAYALAPTRISRVELSECVERGPAECGVRELDYLLTLDGPDSNLVAAATGFAARRSMGHWVLLAPARR